jgi:hypothetical protein
VKLTNGQIVLIEGKGRKEEKDDAKWTAAKRWVAAVNTWGKLGTWSHHVCFSADEARATIDSSSANAS